MSHRYVEVHDGEWSHVKRRGERVMCCDCGLTHVHDFRIINGRIEQRSRRDERATAAARKARKYRQL